MKHSIALSIAAAALGLSALSAAAQETPQVSDQMSRSGFMLENGLIVPAFDPVAGRALFGAKGCAVCHSINGVGGDDAPDISADHMEGGMNAFEFAARMWRGAPAMIAMQEDELGEQIELTGEELADIIAFVHDPEEQAKFTEADIPENILEIINGDEDEG